jgi:hypothetical protein
MKFAHGVEPMSTKGISTIGAYEAKTKFSELLTRVENGGRVASGLAKSLFMFWLSIQHSTFGGII